MFLLQKRKKWVSVPFRGKGFERIEVLELIKGVSTFQSPCGEKVLKDELEMLATCSLQVFQSPCGEKVLKVLFPQVQAFYTFRHVSVPLRGKGFESGRMD